MSCFIIGLWVSCTPPPLPFCKEYSCSFCISSWQKCCFFLLLLAMLIWLPDRNNVMKFQHILYNDQGRLCISLINKWCHDTFKNENLASFFFLLVDFNILYLIKWQHCQAAMSVFNGNLMGRWLIFVFHVSMIRKMKNVGICQNGPAKSLTLELFVRAMTPVTK